MLSGAQAVSVAAVVSGSRAATWSLLPKAFAERKEYVKSLNVVEIEAIHPHWSGFLLISNIDNSIFHSGFDSKGTYVLDGNALTVYWEKFQPDVFIEVLGVYIHQDINSGIPRADKIFSLKEKIDRLSEQTVSEYSFYDIISELRTIKLNRGVKYVLGIMDTRFGQPTDFRF